MSNLANRWAGRIYGTNTGNVFLELNQDGESLTGKLRIMDTIHGLSVYDYTGSIREELLLRCTPSHAEDGTLTAITTVKGQVTQEGSIRGEWQSEIGTAGIFEIYPHDVGSPAIRARDSKPEQIYNKTISLGSFRLLKSDLLQLVNALSKDFSRGKITVTYFLRGSELTKYADDFFEQLEVEQLNYIKLVVQEPEAYGINRSVVVELVDNGVSELRVSGINESWVLGKAEYIFQLLKPKQSFLVTKYRKYGLNLNSVIFALMLIVIPEVKEWESRAGFVISTFILLIVLLYIHNKFIPNTVIYIKKSKLNFISRVWPSIISWFSLVSSTVAASYIFYLLTERAS